MKQQDTYAEVKTFKFADNVVNVYIPKLTSAERKRRLDEIGRLAADMLFEERKSK